MATQDSGYRLYYSPDSANIVIRMYLEVLGVPYTSVLVDRSRGEHLQAGYRRLNPQGLLPVLEDGETVIFETGAILLHLGDKHDGLPALSSPDRAMLYKWLLFLANTVHADLRLNFYTDRYTTEPEAIPGIREATRTRLENHFALLDETLQQTRQGYLLDWGLSPCDLYLAACARWSVLYPPGEALTRMRPMDFPALNRLLERLEQEPAVRQAYTYEGMTGAILTDPAKDFTGQHTR